MSKQHSQPILSASIAALLCALAPQVHAAVNSSSPVIIGTNVINIAGDVSATLGATTFVNHGLVGVGRVSASALDAFGETFGSVSGLAITNWQKTGAATYTGVFNTLPDRGYNFGTTYSDYAARIAQLSFTFTPYTSLANIGGGDLASKVAAQNQIQATYTGAQKFTYDGAALGLNTTGFNPAAGAAGTLTTAVFSSSLPMGSNGLLTLDAEALVLRPDGSGYIGDEYGANIYHFNASKKIDAVLPIPAALKPRDAGGVANYDASSAPAPTDGRRSNQGFEAVSISPDGTKLFAMLQSATIQDSGGGNQGRQQTRVLTYDLTGGPLPATPSAEYVMTLPTLNDGTNSLVPTAANKTAAQSEIVALDSNRFLVLARDSNGAAIQPAATVGNTVTNVPAVFKSVLLVDLNGATDVLGDAAANAAAGKIATGGVLNAGITALSWTEAVNLLNTEQLDRFNIRTDNFSVPDLLTLSEKFEGMSLVSAEDPLAPNDYFLFVANDNDFITPNGFMSLSSGATTFNAISNANGENAAVPNNHASVIPADYQNDTMFMAYRVTIVPEPGSALLLSGGALSLFGLRRRRSAQVFPDCP